MSKFVPNVTTNEEIESASPYSFHYYNENLEMHGDSFPINQNDDEDEGNLRNQIRGNSGEYSLIMLYSRHHQYYYKINILLV